MKKSFTLYRFFPLVWMIFLFFGGFSRFDQTALDRYPVFSDVIDLSKKGEVEWTPKTEHWKTLLGLTHYKGKAMLALIFSSYPGDADDTDLQVEMSAIGVNKNGEKQNRWDGMFNKPFFEPTRMWQNKNLGCVNITGDEIITINMLITEPNLSPKLQCPRFKLIVDYDSAWTGYGRRIQCAFFDILFTALALGNFIIGLIKISPSYFAENDSA